MYDSIFDFCLEKDWNDLILFCQIQQNKSLSDVLHYDTIKW